MARNVGGSEYLDAALPLLKTAKTADELRAVQAFVLPLAFKLNISDTAKIIGRSVGVTCTMRTQFAGNVSSKKKVTRSKRELRNRARFTFEEEAQILEAVMAQANKDNIYYVKSLKPLVEERMDRHIALTTLYDMVSRHKWSKEEIKQPKLKDRRKIQFQWAQGN